MFSAAQAAIHPCIAYVNRFQSRLQLRLNRHVNECIWSTLAQSIRNMHLLADTPLSGRCGSGVRFVVKFESCPDANQCDWRLPAIAGSQGVYPLVAQSHAELANRSGAKCLLDTIVAQYNVFTWVPLPLPLATQDMSGISAAQNVSNIGAYERV